jgi:hypothetical protein
VQALHARHFFRPVDSDSIAILAVHADNIPVAGSPAAIVHAHLQGFYPPGSSSELYFHDIPFNFVGPNDPIGYHETLMRRIVKGLQE